MHLPGCRIVLRAVVIAIHIAVGFSVAASEGEPDAVRNSWFASLDEGRTAAAASGKPLMVVIRCQP